MTGGFFALEIDATSNKLFIPLFPGCTEITALWQERRKYEKVFILKPVTGAQSTEILITSFCIVG